ncbi:MAG: hypothetical protein LC776_19460, partial [Acidobacteria bacterium]|nr:hypothetical protein [Acidobacteriota bacterium]
DQEHPLTFVRRLATNMGVGGDTLSPEETEAAWAQLKQAIAANKINSGLGDLAEQHDHYVYGTEKQK